MLNEITVILPLTRHQVQDHLCLGAVSDPRHNEIDEESENGGEVASRSTIK